MPSPPNRTSERRPTAKKTACRKISGKQSSETRESLEHRLRELTTAWEEETAKRKQIEKELRRVEDNYRIFTNIMHESMTVIAADGTMLFANARTAINFCDGRPEDLIGRNICDFIPPAVAREHLRDYGNVLEENKPVTREVPTMLQGRVRWFLNTLTPVRLGEAGRRAVLSMSVDITERKESEEKLRDSWLKFKQLADNINEVFWIRDAVTREILYISPAYEAVWGRTCRSLYEQPESFLESVHPDDAERVLAAVRRLREGVCFNEEYRIVRPAGEVRWVRARTFPVRNEKGETVRYAGVAEDVTEQRRVADALRVNAGRLRTLSHRLVETQEKERRLIAQELHDEVGQSLTMLRLGLRNLVEALPEAERRNPESLCSLADGLLEKVRDLSLNLRPSMLDDLGLLPALLWQIEAFTGKTGVQVNFRHQGIDRRFTRGIETTAYRVVQEALTNIARHAGVREAALTVARHEGTLLLRIEDNGRGFDLPAAADGATTAGLSGIKERLAMVGGRLEIDSMRGMGACLSAVIPLGGSKEGEHGDPFARVSR